MVRVKKRASKRMTLKQRAKIHKKVKEHGRKQRREARRNPQRKSKKADPGIPNLFPYKEELLNEMEERRRLAAEQRLLSKTKEVDEEEEEEDEEPTPPPVPAPRTRVAAPVLVRPLAEVVGRTSDVQAVVFVLDARDPSSFRRAWLEAQFSPKAGPTLTLALAKADLVPAEALTGWVYDLTRAGLSVFPTSVQAEMESGVDALAAHLQGAKSVAVLGLEHVGKTSLAAALQEALGKKGAETCVYDTPSLVRAAPTSGDEEHAKLLWMLMRNQGQVQRFKDPVALVRTLLPRVAHPVDLMMAYGTPAFGSFVPERATLADEPAEAMREYERQAEAKIKHDTEEFLVGIARSKGRLKRMGIPDTLGAARLLLRDWAHGGLGYYALPHSKAKTVQAKGSKSEKAQWAEAEQLVQAMDVVRPRKEWRQAWASKELRLEALEKPPFDEDALEWLSIEDDDEEDEEKDDDEEEEVDEDDEEVDEDDEEVDEDDEDDEEVDEDDEEVDEEVDEDDEDDEEEDEELDVVPEPVPMPSKKRSQAPKKDHARKMLKPSQAPAKAPRAAPKRRVPAPGEAYDINAYF
ncbi:hypothetical protein MNAN1_001388 [Malassezia nana]|uniref:Guanine nucleotide-binding protein-like 3 N-terminal domain-containing protein n=1 Tax=Malassezia nana TaxID=180528 RepID=A0AAF0J361_9BASI|nr:hypothetical protein MNAN1_001388 [Malassezia nana]